MKNKVKTIRLKPGLEIKGGDIITEDMIEEVIIKQAPKKLAKSEDKYKFSHPATIEAIKNIPNRTEFTSSKQT